MSNKTSKEIAKKTTKTDEVVEKEVTKQSERLIAIFKRFQFLVALLILIVSLGLVILVMSNLFSSANDTSTFSESSRAIIFDQKTIDQIREIEKNSQQPANLPSSGRINPFAN